MQDKDKQIIPAPYTEQEKEYRAKIIRMLQNCRDERDQQHPEFDGLTYLQYYDTNKRADLSYIPPKRNKEDFRIVTGTTREKDTTILSSVMELNLEPNVFAFNEDNMQDHYLGQTFEDLIIDSRIQEDYSKLKPVIYREMISQGDVFVEELWTEEFQPQVEVLNNWTPDQKVDAFQMNEHLKKVFCGPRAKMIPGKKVFVGDIKTMFMKDQPLAFTYEVLTRAKAKTIYGKWDRWQYVPYGVDTMISPEFGDGPVYQDFNWSLYKVPKDQVGVLKLYIPTKNKFMIMLNGVMMMPVNYPLTAISPSGRIPIAQGKFEPIPDFAYSKGSAAKAKVQQVLMDQLLTMYITKTRQSVKPTLGNKTKRVFSSNVTTSGKIINDVSPETLFPIVPTTGVTNAEFQFMGLIRELVNENTVNSVFSGNGTQGDQTATEIVELQKQQMMKMGYAIDSVMNLEKDMSYLRLFNILQNYGTPLDQKVSKDKTALNNVYRSVSVNGAVEDGTEGLKIYRFEDAWPDFFEQLKEEEILTEQNGGKPVRITYITPQMVELMRKKWFIEVNPSEKKSDRLSQLVFMEMIGQTAQLFGPQSLNVAKLKKKFAQKFGVQYDDLFLDQEMLPPEVQDGSVPQINPDGTKPASDATASKTALKTMMA